MKRIKNNKKNKTILLVALLVLITIGYAYLSKLLTINGTAGIDNASWNIHFENYAVTASNNVIPTTAPDTSGNNKTTISYALAFSEPGQVYEFTVDTVNSGTIDAMIKNYQSTIKVGNDDPADATVSANIPDYLVYTVTYDDDTAIQNNHLLAANSSETIKVHLEFKEDINSTQLAEASGKSFVFTVTTNYEQPDGSEVDPHPAPVAAENYVVSPTIMNIGQALPQGVTLKTAANAKADWVTIVGSEKPFYLKQVLNGSDEISESYACFERNNTEYCIKGGDSGAAFLSNAKILYDAFEGQKCYSDETEITDPYDSSYNPNPTSHFYCSMSNLRTDAFSNGLVSVNSDRSRYYCSVYNDGSSRCNQDLG